jgi:hypothetical protein
MTRFYPVLNRPTLPDLQNGNDTLLAFRFGYEARLQRRL